MCGFLNIKSFTKQHMAALLLLNICAYVFRSLYNDVTALTFIRSSTKVRAMLTSSFGIIKRDTQLRLTEVERRIDTGATRDSYE